MFYCKQLKYNISFRYSFVFDTRLYVNRIHLVTKPAHFQHKDNIFLVKISLNLISTKINNLVTLLKNMNLLGDLITYEQIIIYFMFSQQNYFLK